MPRYDVQRYGRKRGASNVSQKVYDEWYHTANKSNGTMTNWARGSRWEQNVLVGGGYAGGENEIPRIGDAMSVDSTTGYWTFPHTGLYKIEFNLRHYKPVDNDFAATNIYFRSGTTDYQLTKAYFIVEHEGEHFMLSNRIFVDISNTSTQAVYFENAAFGSTSNYVTGSSTQNTNSSKVSFERIGDSPSV